MELTKQTICLIREYAKTLVNAGIINQKELSETIQRLKGAPENLPEQKEDRLVSKKEIARLLGYKSPRTVDRLEKKGILERVQNHFGQVRYRISDVDKYIGV